MVYKKDCYHQAKRSSEVPIVTCFNAFPRLTPFICIFASKFDCFIAVFSTIATTPNTSHLVNDRNSQHVTSRQSPQLPTRQQRQQAQTGKHVTCVNRRKSVVKHASGGPLGVKRRQARENMDWYKVRENMQQTPWQVRENKQIRQRCTRAYKCFGAIHRALRTENQGKINLF